MPIDGETDHDPATPFELELTPTSTAVPKRMSHSAHFAHALSDLLIRHHRLDLILVAAIVSTSSGCSLRDPLPAEADTGNGSSPGTQSDGDGPADDTSNLGQTGPGETGSTGAGSTGGSGTGSTSGTATSSSTAASSSNDTGASSTGETSATSTSETSATSTGDIECEIDAWEPNDAPEAPFVVPWVASQATFEAFLCSGESDWYRFDMDSFEYEVYQLRFHGIVEGSSWCGEDCNQPFLPEAPENTMGVEIYDADTLVLLSSEVEPDGSIHIHDTDPAYANDLLFHVYGPTPAATFEYTFDLDIDGYSGEDECEC